MAEAEEDEEEVPRLSSHALAALQEFLGEKNASLDHDQVASSPHAQTQSPILPEDWRLSQFWYDQQTSLTVAQELAFLSSLFHSPIACISCPSLYVEIKRSFTVEARLFEYDRRFQRYGSDFTFYDYNAPEDVPEEHHHAFHIVVADPPYLSEECIEKTAQTMKLLAKDGNSRLLLLTGAVQLEHSRDLLDAHPCSFRPTHTKKLGNEFMLFTNYDPLERLGGWQKS